MNRSTVTDLAPRGAAQRRCRNFERSLGDGVERLDEEDERAFDAVWHSLSRGDKQAVLQRLLEGDE